MGSRDGLAVVVGATGAMGKVITRRLVSEGLRVVAVARDPDALASLERTAPGLIACVADIGSDGSVATIGACLRTLGGPVRLALQGVGVATAGGVLAADVGAVVQAVDIKVGGMMRLARAVDDRLMAGSRLVAIGGHYGFEPSAYAATAGVANAALANLMRQLSWAYGARGVTAHLLAPGPADTERLHRVAAQRAQLEDRNVDGVLAQMRADSALGAFTTPEQVAWAVTTLLAPEADALAGSTLFMDAGRRKGLP